MLFIHTQLEKYKKFLNSCNSLHKALKKNKNIF